MSIYQSNPDRASDDDFEDGGVEHMVAGNRARQLDWRRTPMTVVAVRPDVGFCTMRIDDFEDVGAVWDVPFENMHHYQFERGAPRASDAEIAGFRAAIEQFDRPFEVPCEPARRAETEGMLRDRTKTAERWLAANSTFLAADGVLPDPGERRGDERLYADLEAYVRDHGVDDIDAAFSRQFVSNPYAGEIVKGHRVVLAELGLVPYVGTVVRDPATLAGAWSRDRRAQHLIARIAFARALFRRLGVTHVTLHRGFTAHGSIEASRNETFVSASFSPDVARSHLHDPSGVLLEQEVPVDRVVMTYLETRAMNEMFLEAEAILLFDPDNARF